MGVKVALVFLFNLFLVVQCKYNPHGDRVLPGSVLLPATRRGRYLANIIRRQAVDGTGIKFNKDADRINAESKHKVDVLSDDLLPHIIAEQERRATLYKRVMTAIQNGEKGVTIAEIRGKDPLFIRKGALFRCPSLTMPKEPDGSGILMCENNIEPSPIIYDSCLSAEDRYLYNASDRFFFCNRHMTEPPDLPYNESKPIACAPVERTPYNYTVEKCALEGSLDVVVHYRYYPDKTYRFHMDLDPDHEVCDHWNPCQIGYIFDLPRNDVDPRFGRDKRLVDADELWVGWNYENDERVPPDKAIEHVWPSIKHYRISTRKLKIPPGYKATTNKLMLKSKGNEVEYPCQARVDSITCDVQPLIGAAIVKITFAKDQKMDERNYGTWHLVLEKVDGNTALEDKDKDKDDQNGNNDPNSNDPSTTTDNDEDTVPTTTTENPDSTTASNDQNGVSPNDPDQMRRHSNQIRRRTKRKTRRSDTKSIPVLTIEKTTTEFNPVSRRRYDGNKNKEFIKVKCTNCRFMGILVRTKDGGPVFLDSDRYSLTTHAHGFHFEISLENPNMEQFGDYFVIYQLPGGTEERIKVLSFNGGIKFDILKESLLPGKEFEQTVKIDTCELPNCELQDVVCSTESVVDGEIVTLKRNPTKVIFNFQPFEDKHSCVYTGIFKVGDEIYKETLAVIENNYVGPITQPTINPLSYGQEVQQEVPFSCQKSCDVSNLTVNGMQISKETGATRRYYYGHSGGHFIVVTLIRIVIRIYYFSPFWCGIYQAVFVVQRVYITRTILEIPPPVYPAPAIITGPEAPPPTEPPTPPTSTAAAAPDNLNDDNDDQATDSANTDSGNASPEPEPNAEQEPAAEPEGEPDPEPID